MFPSLAAIKPSPTVLTHWFTHFPRALECSDTSSGSSIAQVQLRVLEASAEHLASQSMPCLLHGMVVPVSKGNGIIGSEDAGPTSHTYPVPETHRIQGPAIFRLNQSFFEHKLSLRHPLPIRRIFRLRNPRFTVISLSLALLKSKTPIFLFFLLLYS